ncbi:MAG: VOC family protein [Chloroflexi bacterium]|nr:MAG: VOC family protein [Chloroflexota bacterium]
MHVDNTQQGIPSWVELMTSDEDAAVRFYGDLFNWVDNAQDVPGENGGTYHLATLGGDNIAGIGTERQPGVPPHWSIYFAVDDAVAVAAKVPAAGGQVIVPPTDVMNLGRMAIVADPTGAPIGLWEAKLHKGFGRRDEPGSVSWCELLTDDAAQATAFFTNILGVPAEEMAMQGYSYTLLGPTVGRGAGIMSKTPEMGSMPTMWGVYFEVADTDATVAKARDLGATVLNEPQDMMAGRWAMLADPQGAVFGIIKSAPMP